MAGPITPNEVVAQKAKYLPSVVFDVVNELIGKHWNGSYAKIQQKEIEDSLLLNSEYERKEIFEMKLLDFEDVYRAVGWNVKYDKPAWNEDYEANFTFRRAS